MKSLKIDARILQSKKAIKQAFLILMEEKKYEKISIKEICDKAFINRKTFYAHYQSKEDLYHQIIEDVIRLLQLEKYGDIALNIQNQSEFKQSLIEMITNIFEIIKANRKMLMVIFENSQSSYLQNRIENALFGKMKWNALAKMESQRREFSAYLLHNMNVAFFMSTFKWWIYHEELGLDESIEMILYTFEKNLASLIWF